MGDLGGLTSQLTSSSFGRDAELGVRCLDAACTVGLNSLSKARNPDKPTQNKLKTNKNKQMKEMQLLMGEIFSAMGLKVFRICLKIDDL